MNITLEPRVVQWARERAGLDESALAKKLGIKAERVIEWETTGEIPYKKAELLAQKTHTPFGHLFLSSLLRTPCRSMISELLETLQCDGPARIC